MPKAKYVNHNYFDVLTPRSAWLLGFWTADGCTTLIGKNSWQICFTQKDSTILYTIKRELDAEHEVSSTEKISTFAFTSKHMNDTLCRIFGVKTLERKSNILPWPVNLPERLFWHFMRGWIDGDGCFSVYPADGICRFNLTSGSVNILKKASEGIKKRTGIKCKIQRVANKAAHLICSGINAKIVIHHLYQNAELYCIIKKVSAEKIKQWTLGQVPRNLSQKTVNLYPELISQSLAHGQAKCKAGYYGVRKRSKNSWEVRVGNIHSSHHRTAEIAARVHDKIAREVFGVRALLNFP